MTPLAPSPYPSRQSRPGYLLLLGLIVLFAGAKTILYDTLDPDCFWHLCVGEQLSREGVKPLVDHLSFASSREPWTPYSWLAEIAMSRLWNWGGFRAAVAVTSLIVAGTIGLIALCCRELVVAARPQQSRQLATVLATAIGTFLTLPYLSFRPVTLAIFLLALCSWLILHDRRLNERSAVVWLVPPITALLTNIHLYSILIPMCVGAVFFGAVWERMGLSDVRAKREMNRRVKRYAGLLAGSILACVLTPMLPGMLRAAMYYGVRDPMVASNIIAEMLPFTAGPMGKVSLALLAGLTMCVFRERRRVRAGELLWFLFATALLFRLGRFSPVFALIAAPLFAVTLPDLSDQVLARRSLQAVVTAVLCMGFWRTLAAFPDRSTDLNGWLNRGGTDVPGYPTEAAAFVADHILPSTGHLLNEFNWGGFLEWRLGNRYQILVDGRTQVYSARFWQELYLGTESARAQKLALMHADAAILPLGKSLFRDALLNLGWKTVHRDERAEVLVPMSNSITAVPIESR